MKNISVGDSSIKQGDHYDFHIFFSGKFESLIYTSIREIFYNKSNLQKQKSENNVEI